jgi:hypothetical protein
MSQDRKMRWTVKGKRPAFNEQSIDRLFSMVMALTSEMAVLRHRVDSMQKLAEQDGWLKDGALENYRPDLGERKDREAWREQFLARIMYVIEEELADLQSGDSEERYWSTVADIEAGDA